MKVVEKVSRIDGRGLLINILEDTLAEVKEGKIVALAIAIERPSYVSHRYVTTRGSDTIRLLGAVARLSNMIQHDLDETSVREK